jgi:multiple sugar transport system substrate-binding protein
MDDDGRVVVDSPEAIRALTFMRTLVRSGRSPEEVLTWHEEETRFAFQNGNALLMRNWPYAYGLMNDTAESRVAGRFSIAPMPAAPGGEPTAALGGNVLAINVNSDVADAAHRLIAFLTAPQQQIDRAATSGYPTLRTLYDDPRLARTLPVPVGPVKSIVEHARPRPATPIWSQLSELLQIRLHRALTGQAEPAAALHDAAQAMNALIERTGVRELMASSGGDPR